MKKLLICLICLMAMLGVTACGGANDVTPPEKLPDYSFTNPEVPNNDWRDLTPESEITIDGKFNETVYNNLIPLTFSDAKNDGSFNCSVASYMGEKGIYIKTNVTDSTLYYNIERPVFQNSCAIFYISPYANGENPTLNENVIQARVGLNGYIEQWMGKPSADGYKYVRIYAPMMSRVVIKNGANDVAYTKNGNINLETGVTGYDIETFVPYKSFGLDAKPSNYLIMPEINKCSAFTGENARTMIQPAGMNYLNPSSFGGFNDKGFMANGIIDGVNLGKGASTPTLGWDVSGDNETANKTIVQKGDTDQKIYFKNINSTKYLIEAEMTVNNVMNNDNFPKFGLIAGENSANTYCFFVDPTKSLENKWVLAVGRNDDQTNWDWPAGMKDFPTMAYKDGAKVKLSVARDGGDFYFFVNDALAGIRSNVRGLGATDKSYAGFMTMNMATTYTNYTATTDTAAVDAKITAHKSLKGIDGDLSDWTADEKTNSKRVYGIETFTAQGFEVYSKFVKNNGLYIAGIAKHKTNPAGSEKWWENTNFEFFINGDHQKWVTSAANSGINAKLVITGENGDYTSTFEVFIPIAEIPGQNADSDFVRLGFAFKVAGENIKILNRDGGNATDWWWENGHDPRHGEQYYIYSDGLYNTAKA